MPKSIVEELREKGAAKLKEIRETVGPMITEETELAAMLPDEERHFHTADETKAAVAEASPPEEAPAPAPARPSGSNGSGSSEPRKRRRRAGGTRADQAVALVEKQPGISASDVAKELKIKPNYLYRVLGDLEKEGRVKKDGREYFPVA